MNKGTVEMLGKDFNTVFPYKPQYLMAHIFDFIL